jgi:hypothetical protein
MQDSGVRNLAAYDFASQVAPAGTAVEDHTVGGGDDLGRSGE